MERFVDVEFFYPKNNYLQNLCNSQKIVSWQFLSDGIYLLQGDTVIQLFHNHGGNIYPHRKWIAECFDGICCYQRSVMLNVNVMLDLC